MKNDEHFTMNLKRELCKVVTETTIDVLPSKNQALCEYCTLKSKQVKTWLIF